jgi:hypothetical protein
MDRFATGRRPSSESTLLRAFKAMNLVFSRLATDYESGTCSTCIHRYANAGVGHPRKNRGRRCPKAHRATGAAFDWGDVLWFRTGGARPRPTSAHLLRHPYDRLRDKKHGVTAWLRFPLRMLSVQQLQRAMRMVWRRRRSARRCSGTRQCLGPHPSWVFRGQHNHSQ